LVSDRCKFCVSQEQFPDPTARKLLGNGRFCFALAKHYQKTSRNQPRGMKKIRSAKQIKGVSIKEADNGLEAEKARLREKDPSEWTVSDVGKWLDFIDMGQYKMVFIENRLDNSLDLV